MARKTARSTLMILKNPRTLGVVRVRLAPPEKRFIQLSTSALAHQERLKPWVRPLRGLAEVTFLSKTMRSPLLGGGF